MAGLGLGQQLARYRRLEAGSNGVAGAGQLALLILEAELIELAVDRLPGMRPRSAFAWMRS